MTAGSSEMKDPVCLIQQTYLQNNIWQSPMPLLIHIYFFLAKRPIFAKGIIGEHEQISLYF